MIDRKHTHLLFGLMLAVSRYASAGCLWAQEGSRPVTVRDSITMRNIGDPAFEYFNSSPARFSPDGRRFAIITRTGDLDCNCVHYSLLLFKTAEAYQTPNPEIVARFLSTSNNPGIVHATWISNEVLGFLGARRNGRQQIYAYNLRTRALVQRTHKDTDIVSFAVARGSKTLVYLARPPVRSFFDRATVEHGLVVSHQFLPDLVNGRPTDQDSGSVYPYELFVLPAGRRARRIDLDGQHTSDLVGLFPSPDGNFAVVWTYSSYVPGTWRRYKEAIGGSYVIKYTLVDLRSGDSKLLIDAPLSPKSFFSQVAWSTNSRSVVVSNTYLPLSLGDDGQMARTFLAEVDVRTGGVTEIAATEGNLVGSSPRSNAVTLEVAATGPSPVSAKKRIVYQKRKGRWVQAKGEGLVDDPAEVREQQGINTPPYLTITQHGTQKTTRLLDLNPQFRRLRLGKVEQISWQGSDGHDEQGGLYLPPDYSPGRKYPLIIQTHGWDGKKFWIDGVSTAGYAAQALAGRGFVVAQTDDTMPDAEGTSREGQREMAMYEGLIDYLDARALIDRDRVGLLGWSRTGYRVRYALTFSKYHFGAAVIADGMDGSYFQYMVEGNNPDGGVAAGIYEKMHGAPPFGVGLQKWAVNATGFNLDRVHTPLRILVFGGYTILDNWEWFVGLQRRKKPVEMIWLRDALHIPVKPQERFTAQQGSVDWFCYWLKNEEDPDPSKAAQYVRWRQMREQESADLAAPGTRP